MSYFHKGIFFNLAFIKNLQKRTFIKFTSNNKLNVSY